MLTTRSGAYISRFGDFCVHDDNDDTTDHFTPAHARGVKILWATLVVSAIQINESKSSYLTIWIIRGVKVLEKLEKDLILRPLSIDVLGMLLRIVHPKGVARVEF